LYDGDGQRVEKSGPAGATVYVYDVQRRLAAEYSTASSTSPCTTCYLSSDQLGSTRLVTDFSGSVVGRHDYLPFGEEVSPNTLDNISQKFTGQERDSETGMDFFHARYFGAALGRFTSPDPANAGADITNPQSWNAYAYVLGNPLALVDPSGLEVTCGGDPYTCIDNPPPTRACKWWEFWCWGGGGGSDSGAGLDFGFGAFPSLGAGSQQAYQPPPRIAETQSGQPANTGTNSCAVQRIAATAKGIVSLGVGFAKIELAEGSALSTPVTGTLGAVGTAYGLIGASGNIAAGALQLAGAITGNVRGFGEAANAASTLTTAGGLTVFLVTRGNLSAASTAASFESLGTAGVNGGATGHFIDQGATLAQKFLLSTELGQNLAEVAGLNISGSCR
jgi:RHS repeat-associated protein